MKRVHDLLLYCLLPGIRNAPQYSASPRYGPSVRNLSVLVPATALISLVTLGGKSKGFEGRVNKLCIHRLNNREAFVS
jgi:hypothetical protein